MALATADASTLPTTVAASRGVLRRISAACSTSLSRMRSSTTRALVADMRKCRSTARVPGRSLVFSPGISTPPGALLAGVVPEGPGGGELPQLVADHRFGHVDRDVAPAVVHGDGVTDHVGDDGGAPGP